MKYKADFVLDLRLAEYTITTKIRASIDGEGGITKGHCDYPRGNWIFSHMLATAIYTNKKGMSKTDLPNTWIAKPKKAARTDSKTFADFFSNPKPQYRATSRDVISADCKFLNERKINSAIS